MNKFVKGCLIVSSVLIIIGFIVVGVSFAMGARISDLPNMSIRIGNGYAGIRGIGFGNGGGRVNRDIGDIADNIVGDDSHSGIVIDDVVEFDKDEITSLEFDFGAIEAIVEKGDKFSVKASENLSSYLKYELENGELSIYNTDVHLFGGNNYTVWITVPEDAQLEDFSLDIGGGIFNSNVEFTTRETDISVGAGSVNIVGISSMDTSVDCAAGKVNLEGKLAGSMDIECGMGTVNVIVYGNQSDYSMTGEVGLGKLKFGDRDYTGIGDVRFGDYGARNTIDVSLAMGKIDIDFE